MSDRGALLAAPGDPASVEEIALDGPGPGEVRVRLAAAGVCHTDLHVQESGGWGMRFPILLGHEGAGTVEEVGEGVPGLAPGDAVVLAWRAPCGSCAACLRGAPRLCRTPLRARRRLHRASDGAALSAVLDVGAFATRTVVHAAAAIRVPEQLPPEQACLLGCGVVTGVGAVLNTSPARAGSTVAVVGCGGVGLSAVQGARLAHAGRIVALDVAPRKLEWARRFGATDTVDAGSTDPVAAVRELTGGEGVDFAYDAVGRPETLAQAVRMLAHAGTATLIGVPQAGTRLELDLERDLFRRRATLRVSHGGDHLPAHDLPLLARLALDGELDLAGMVTREVGLDDVEEAFAAMRAGETIRTVIRL